MDLLQENIGLPAAAGKIDPRIAVFIEVHAVMGFRLVDRTLDRVPAAV